jgi:hypothetical protein
MEMPFTTDQFFDVFRQYNEAVWPTQAFLAAMGLAIAVQASRSSRSSRLVAGTLALLWLWMAIGYHLVFFTAINPLAYLFAAMFLVEAVLLGWHGLRTQRLRLAPQMTRSMWIAGGVLVLYSLVAYPVIGFALGERYPELPTFGLPCPTTIFTLGLLMWFERPIPGLVLVVPAVWSAIGSFAALSFGVGQDYALIPATALVIGAQLWRRGQPHPASGAVQYRLPGGTI